MDDFHTLLERFWVRKTEDRDLFHRLRRKGSDYAGTVNELLGWNLVMNDSVVKLEKVPVKAQPWMGIQEFQQPMDYCLLCALLLFLADEDAGRQFLLSTLLERISMITAEVCPVDWAQFLHRKSLVRVLRYAQSVGLVLVYDGDSERFSSDQSQEVLFHNTGLCHHFTVHFGRDIEDLHTVEDFEAALGGDPERDRRRRVCRQLMLGPAIYWHPEEDMAEYNYVKHQHHNLERRMQELADGSLQVHRNGAFYALEREDRYGEMFPADKGMADIALQMCSILRERVLAEEYPLNRGDMAEISRREFGYRFSECRSKYKSAWNQLLRQQGEKSLMEDVLKYMESWMLVEDHGDRIVITPAAAKWNGHYPPDFDPQSAEREEAAQEFAAGAADADGGDDGNGGAASGKPAGPEMEAGSGAEAEAEADAAGHALADWEAGAGIGTGAGLNAGAGAEAVPVAAGPAGKSPWREPAQAGGEAAGETGVRRRRRRRRTGGPEDAEDLGAGSAGKRPGRRRRQGQEQERGQRQEQGGDQ